jgi:hypothetical protein
MAFPVPETLFDRLAPRLPGVPARGWVALAGVVLAAGTAAIAFHHPWIGGGLLLAGFLADGAGQAAARAGSGTSAPLLPLGVMLAPFGFALAAPERALAAMFLLFSLAVLLWVSERRVRLIHWLAALGLLIACILPDRFSLLAYLLGIACFVKAGQVVA